MTREDARMMLPGPGDIAAWLEDMDYEGLGSSEIGEKLIDHLVDFIVDVDEPDGHE